MPVRRCYNKGCGIEYDSDVNNSNSCVYHPGEPIFHDAKKKWSCCLKYSTDFTEFLNMKGCTYGPHSSEKCKPAVVSKPVNDTPSPVPVSVPPPSVPPIVATQPRPSADAPLISLPSNVTGSLKNALEALKKQKSATNKSATASEDGNTDGNLVKVEIGTSCKNSGCNMIYTGPENDAEICKYHPGAPVFHEGMKFWSCCQRKTSEFETFMNQIGCETGHHNWTAESAAATNVMASAAFTECRFDFFQLAEKITLSVYAKNTLPETVVIRANSVFISIAFAYDGGKARFDRTFNLYGVIDPANSLVNLMGTKVEIVLHKSEPCSWPALECYSQTTKENITNGETTTTT